MNHKNIDLAKFIMSIGIVMLHITPINPEFLFVNNILGFITSLCVPLFFVFSSFLFNNRSSIVTKEQIIHFVKRIGILYIFWLFVFVLIQSLFDGIKNGIPALNNNIIKNIIFGSTFGGSWFYSALVISICIYCVAKKYISSYIIMTTSILIYFYFVVSLNNITFGNYSISNFYDYYQEHLGNWFLSFPYAIIWICMGGEILNMKKIYYFNICAILISLFIYFFSSNGNSVVSWFLRLAFVEIIAILCIKFRSSIEGVPYKKLRGMSVLIFMIHLYFLYHVNTTYYIFGILSLKFIVTLISTLLLSYLFVCLSDIKRLHFLKRFF